MALPFTAEQFFSLFGLYNTWFWPAAVVLWMATVLVFLHAARAPRGSDIWVPALLAVHWAWAAVAYHALLFTRVNPAAWLFSALFLVQAALFVWFGLVQRRLRVAPRGGVHRWASRLFVVYALLYPVLAQAEGHTYPQVPTFGLPCPSVVLTIGAVLAWQPPVPRVLMVIPLLWSLVGGSASVLLGVRADIMLFVAAIALAVDVAFTRGGAPSDLANTGACGAGYSARV